MKVYFQSRYGGPTLDLFSCHNWYTPRGCFTSHGQLGFGSLFLGSPPFSVLKLCIQGFPLFLAFIEAKY